MDRGPPFGRIGVGRYIAGFGEEIGVGDIPRRDPELVVIGGKTRRRQEDLHAVIRPQRFRFAVFHLRHFRFIALDPEIDPVAAHQHGKFRLRLDLLPPVRNLDAGETRMFFRLLPRGLIQFAVHSDFRGTRGEDRGEQNRPECSFHFAFLPFEFVFQRQKNDLYRIFMVRNAGCSWSSRSPPAGRKDQPTVRPSSVTTRSSRPRAGSASSVRNAAS